LAKWNRDTKKDKTYDGTHNLRWILTLDLIKKRIDYISEARSLLALGTDGQFEKTLKTVYRDLEIDISDWDLRFSFPKLDNSYDVCLSLEVIEHLKDRDDEFHDVATHYFTGLMSFLVEAHRVLKPGGLLIITTPNSSSFDTIFRTIQGKSNFMYWPHVRELAPMELSYFLNQAGFQINSLETFSPYENDFRSNNLHIGFLDFFRKLLRAEPAMRHLRGSTIFLVAQKTGSPKDVLLETEWHQVKLDDIRGKK
jgi:SAM-dependent methyltransferase